MESTKTSSNGNMKSEWSIYTLDDSSGSGVESGWENVGLWPAAGWKKGDQSWGQGFPEVCGPRYPDELPPQWGRGEGLSPFDKATAAVGSEVSWWHLKLWHSVSLKNKRTKLCSWWPVLPALSCFQRDHHHLHGVDCDAPTHPPIHPHPLASSQWWFQWQCGSLPPARSFCPSTASPSHLGS